MVCFFQELTRGNLFASTLMCCREGLVNVRKQGGDRWKAFWNMPKKKDRKTTLHPFQIVSCNRCSLVFLVLLFHHVSFCFSSFMFLSFFTGPSLQHYNFHKTNVIAVLRSRWECSCKNLNNFVSLLPIVTGLVSIDSAQNCAHEAMYFMLLRV